MGTAVVCDAGEASSLINKSATWHPLNLKNPVAAEFAADGSRVGLEFKSSMGIDGIYCADAHNGHFEVDANLQDSINGGLALVHFKDSEPDYSNLVGIVFELNSKDQHVVRIVCKQNGNPCDFTQLGKPYLSDGKTEAKPRLSKSNREIFNSLDRHRHVLDKKYSMPFAKPDGRIKIARNSQSNTFYLYYGVIYNNENTTKHGWIELLPIPDWLSENALWVPALISSDSKPNATTRISCNHLSVRLPAEVDQDDHATGFKANKRSFTWSGYSGDAVVITYDDRFPFSSQDYKFVFWERANYVPVWRLDNQTLFSYEFVETWDDEGRGCYEPMSDRLGLASKVSIIEDNPVRKIVEWRYELINPDYLVPSQGEGDQRPEVKEQYTFYPNGKVIRHIQYFPKLDGKHRKWNELCEFIVIAGNQFNPQELISSPALTITRDSTKNYDLLPGKAIQLENSDTWNVLVAAAHFKNHPDAIAAFCNNRNLSALTPGNRVRADVSWHRPYYRMSHWPVSLEPYQTEDKSVHGARHQVTHTSLVGFSPSGDNTWQRDYETDNRGRKYREWASLISLSESMDALKKNAIVRSWLYPGKMNAAESKNVSWMINDLYQGEVVIDVHGQGEFSFLWEPVEELSKIKSPCFRFTNFSGPVDTVLVDGKKLISEIDYSSHAGAEGLLVWLNVSSKKSIRITVKTAD